MLQLKERRGLKVLGIPADHPMFGGIDAAMRVMATYNVLPKSSASKIDRLKKAKLSNR